MLFTIEVIQAIFSHFKQIEGVTANFVIYILPSTLGPKGLPVGAKSSTKGPSRAKGPEEGLKGPLSYRTQETYSKLKFVKL